MKVMMWHIYKWNIYSAIKKNEIMPLATWMELECIMMLHKISRSKKDKYHMISLMWDLRNKTDEHMGWRDGWMAGWLDGWIDR